jgi:hypothetical protein
MKRIGESLTYANVVATLALFLALTGAAAFAATQLAKNSVGPKQLRKNAVTKVKIKKGAVTPAKIGGMLPGLKVDASTLGVVPSAAQAGNSQTVRGLTPDQIAATSRLRCPDGMVLASGICFEPTARPAAEWLSAVSICAQAGRRVPAPSELIAFETQTYTEAPPPEWVGEISASGPNVMLVSAGPLQISIESKSILLEAPYRCAVNPLN